MQLKNSEYNSIVVAKALGRANREAESSAESASDLSDFGYPTA
jgi:hypothetical protein